MLLNQNSRNWISFHVFFSSDFDGYLKNTVAPLIEDYRRDLSSFFFIRYGEGGPHIRLRINIFDSSLESFCISQFVKQLNNNLPLNNKIQQIDYNPEIERYGGPVGLEISEKHFACSSNAALEFIKSLEWKYSYAMGIALHLHLIFSLSSKICFSKLKILFEIIASQWMQLNFSKEGPQTTINEVYGKLDVHCGPFITKLLNFLIFFQENEHKCGNSCLNNWYVDCKATFEQLNRYYDLLIAPDFYKKYSERGIDELSAKLFSISESYIHMTNNRLGITNNDEGLLAYVLMKVFEKASEEISQYC